MNLHDFYTGNSFDAYNFFGAHKEGEQIVFRTYAPNAKSVNIIGSFNEWNEEPMYHEGNNQVFVYRNGNAKFGDMYKYVIYSQNGERREHCDPYSFGMELRPNFASYIVDFSAHEFSDEKWMKTRSKNYNEPMNIYELHLGSWKTNPENENGWFSYSEIADELLKYVKANGYTHIEFMPLSEHPADCSWGYQNTGFFSPTSRYGTASELQELIDKCHKAGIGAIIDFVPVHFAVDGYALAKYDGTDLYEYPSSDVGTSEWGSYNFIHSRGEVCSFLQSAANYWLKEFHFDGIRMDAISRAIYWQGEPARGVNGNTVNFIKNMNSGLHKLHPTAILIAEDSTSYPKITAPVEYDGLGFDYKWDLGWMNDTLNYFKTPPAERPYHYHKLTFSMAYFYNELYILPLSHDENVHGKATIIQKMWGDYDIKFPQCRAMYMYMYTHPGKKLNFMGNEIAQFREWDETKEQDWDLVKYPLHDSFKNYMKQLSKLYLKHASMFDGDYNSVSFKWLVVDACEQSCYVYERSNKLESIICAFNFSDKEQIVSFKPEEKWCLTEILNSDWNEFGGNTEKKKFSKTFSKEVKITLQPFSGRIFKKVAK